MFYTTGALTQNQMIKFFELLVETLIFTVKFQILSLFHVLKGFLFKPPNRGYTSFMLYLYLFKIFEIKIFMVMKKFWCLLLKTWWCT